MRHKKLTLTLLLIISFWAVKFCWAQSDAKDINDEIKAEIDIKNSFSVGEKLGFTIFFSSTRDVKITYNPYISCDLDIPLAATKNSARTAIIQNEELYQDEYIDIEITNDILSQECSAIIQITAPFSKKIEKKFTIDTEPRFSFNLQYCRDESCDQKSKVFIAGDEVYLQYLADVGELDVQGKLTYPDGTVNPITLPHSFTATQIGNYELEIKATKQGYKTVAKNDLFGVIESAPIVQSASKCVVNEVCASPETYQNCPQDCKGPIDKKAILLYIGGIILILVASGALMAIFIKRKKGVNNNL